MRDQRCGGNSAKLTRDQIADLSSKMRMYTPCWLFGPDTATADGLNWTVADLQRASMFCHTYQRLEGLAERFEAYLTDTTCHSSFLEQYDWSLSCPSFTLLLHNMKRVSLDYITQI